MSAIRAETEKKHVPDLDEAAKNNPKVDGDQIREAQELLREIRRDGGGGPTYNIDSPYERGPVGKPES
jgi:hypothetical protein